MQNDAPRDVARVRLGPLPGCLWRQRSWPPAGVTLDGSALTEHADLATLRASSEGWLWVAADLALVVRFADREGYLVEMSYDPTLTEPRPWVEVPLTVHVPPGTPAGPSDPVVHVASDVDGWVQHPLAWGTEPDTAVGSVSVPRGEWFEFKYTRGDWDTVEKWPGCVEAANRYGFGEARPGRDDTVFTWRDWCPP